MSTIRQVFDEKNDMDIIEELYSIIINGIIHRFPLETFTNKRGTFELIESMAEEMCDKHMNTFYKSYFDTFVDFKNIGK